MLDAGCTAPLIGDFHYNGHLLLTRYPDVRGGARQMPASIPATSAPASGATSSSRRSARWRVDHGKPVRIGVNGGSLNQELVLAKMQENTDRDLGQDSEEIINECMVISAVESTALALEAGLRKDQIIISCKVSRPRDLIAVYRDARRRRTDQPLHLGLTEAGMGIEGPGLVGRRRWACCCTKASATPSASRSRRSRAAIGARRSYAACELLQALGLRAFAPSVTACPGCGRTTSTTFQELAERVQDYIREQMPDWKTQHDGVETMTLAVMGCVVNGPGESKAANIGISLPGTGEAPNCPVFIDGQHATTLRSIEELATLDSDRRIHVATKCT